MQQLKKKTRDISLSSKDNKGFTIIEVMIVLVIAAVIILIVFLAVPALQRNSRNNQRRNDVARVLGLVNEYASNNSGATPTGITCTGTTVGTGHLDLRNESFSNYQCANFSIGDIGSTTAASDINLVLIRTNARCSNAQTAASGAGSRAFVALFMVETASSPQSQCQAS